MFAKLLPLATHVTREQHWPEGCTSLLLSRPGRTVQRDTIYKQIHVFAVRSKKMCQQGEVWLVVSMWGKGPHKDVKSWLEWPYWSWECNPVETQRMLLGKQVRQVHNTETSNTAVRGEDPLSCLGPCPLPAFHNSFSHASWGFLLSSDQQSFHKR